MTQRTLRELLRQWKALWWCYHDDFCHTCRAEDWDEMYGFDCPKCRGTAKWSKRVRWRA